MNTEIRSTNPVVKAIVEGTVPKPAQFAAARGILPLPQADLVEALVTQRVESGEIKSKCLFSPLSTLTEIP